MPARNLSPMINAPFAIVIEIYFCSLITKAQSSCFLLGRPILENETPDCLDNSFANTLLLLPMLNYML